SAREQQRYENIDDFGHPELTLADADGFDEGGPIACGLAQAHGTERPHAQASTGSWVGAWPYGRGRLREALHARPVAEQAATMPRGGVVREHGRPQALAQHQTTELVDERALAHAGRPRDAQTQRAGPLRQPSQELAAGTLRAGQAALQQRDRLAEGPPVSGLDAPR